MSSDMSELDSNACPCGSGRTRPDCCGPLLDGLAPPATAEALMRSRYSAFVEKKVEYLGDTLHPDHRADYDPVATRQWAENSTWIGLEILSTAKGLESDDVGRVEFIARYSVKGEAVEHRELATFARHGGRWTYVDGVTPKPSTFVHEGPRIGRNDPCACGSGKKAKKCCAA